MSLNLIQNLKFDERGLIPAVVQDDKTNEILMLAYMNAESLQQTLQTGETHFWSRSRNELWHKGGTSGNTQRVVDVRIDCDSDALIVRVNPDGPACHTGEQTCFFRDITQAVPAAPQQGVSLVNVESMEIGILLNNLYTLIAERKEEKPEGSYTTYLFNSGLDKILKKIGEESAETIIAAKNGSAKEMSAEISDLLYHLLVLMVERDVKLKDIQAELSSRVGRAADPKYTENSKPHQ
ncbi:MAG TPA: bifunctional phosphoribosyl-AMP cyclohydrolase/phosphoribosyl-ATP diphosphatase HisIE [Blastocatellia bacterium]|nr:bifunctional phosphoribosyl-AMP cyclohydrolase/phosphoribosyl-ATP diphosphatase HisIE [Blastocatellia bacterium]